ncbi:MAG: hypothetical protein KDA28_06230, partial [Phycisphaerales bacterium]|nr:hypothetical protein [Phycisphaerales bacterium]
ETIELHRTVETGTYTWATISLAREEAAVEVSIQCDWDDQRPAPGFGGSVRMPFRMNGDTASLRADTPYAVSNVEGGGEVSRKYPEGDWMTSPQWFEHVEGSIVAHSFVDLLDARGAGLLICHDGSQQWFRRRGGVEVVVDAYCPWDEDRYDIPWGVFRFAIMPHAPMRDADRVRFARSCVLEHDEGGWTPPVGGGDPANAPSIPTTFGALEVTNADNVLAHAFHRDCMKSGEHLDDWAGHRMATESNGDCTHPFVIRLVEWNGDDADVVLKLPGDIALVAKTNLMGECGLWPAGQTPSDAPAHLHDTGWLTVEPTIPPEWARDAMLGEHSITWSEVRFHMRPREISTIMADLVMGRKQVRDLDAKREVWATIHRTD